MLSEYNSHNEMQKFLGTNDEVVNKTDWTPLNGGGQNFKSHNLIKLNFDRLQFRISLGAALFYSLFIVVGFSLILVTIFWDMFNMGSGDPFLTGLIGLVFAIVGLFMFYKGRKRITIDRAYPALWKGNVEPSKVINPSSIDGYTSLKKLHAIQLIEEHISGSGDSKSYDSYEINFVFRDGTRVHVVDHGDEKSIVEQSNQLADFLAVPLWDGRGTVNGRMIRKPPASVMKAIQLYDRVRKSFIAIVFTVIFFAFIYKMFF